MAVTSSLVAATLFAAAIQAGQLDGGNHPEPTSGGPTVPAERVFMGAEGQLTLPNPFLARPEIDIDGDLSEAAWNQAVVLDGFTQYDPQQGVPASQTTRVLILMSDDAVFVGIQAFDDNPAGIRATLSQRDGYTRNDDYVRVVLDTYNAQREAFVFTVNPYGVQHDGRWSEGGGRGRGMFGPPIDSNPDYIWDSAARRNEQGWFAEMKIPLKSLRFPKDPLQDWGIQIYRRIQRNDFDESWAPIDSNIANQLTQIGTLTDLRDLDPGMFLQFNPVVTAKAVGTIDDETGAFQRENPNADFGFNATYGVTSNLILDGTYNPDFSQVEADVGQILVNERFTIFLPEKRPFFLEGTEIFKTPRPVVYTRSIVNPIAGAKLTGKLAGFNLGYLGAIDEFTSSDDIGSAYVNLLRARRDLGGSSTVGLVFTDRSETSQVYNRLLAADTRLVFRQRYTLDAQVSGSIDGRSGLQAETGGQVYAKLNRSGRNLAWNGEFENSTPDFRAGSGSIRRVGIARTKLGGNYNWYGPGGATIQRWGPRWDLEGLWDHDDFWDGQGMKEYRASGTVSATFKGNVSVWATGGWKNFDYALDDYDGLYSGNPDEGTGTEYRPDQAQFQNLLGASLNLFMNRWERVRGNLRGGWEQTPIFDRITRSPVETANKYSANLSLNLFVSTGLRGEVGIRHESLFRTSDGSRYSSATIPRIETQYQFSKAFFLRTIVEYAAQESQNLVNPQTGEDLYYCTDDGCYQRDGGLANNINVQFLAAYEPSPGTVVFLGYSRFMIEEQAFGFDDLQPQNDGFFLKVSYLFRM